MPEGALIEEELEIGPHALRILRPPDAEALLDEKAFEHEEFLPYWAELWPSGVALGRAVTARGDLRGARVLELGCGLGIPSVCAALAGATVLATDWSPHAVEATARNAALNGVVVETAVRRWDDLPSFDGSGSWTLVLAADVLYERRNIPLLLELLPRLDAREILLADPGRPAAAEFLEAAASRWRVDASPDEVAPRVTVYRLHPYARRTERS